MKAVLPVLLLVLLIVLYRRKKLKKKFFILFLSALAGVSAVLAAEMYEGETREVTSLEKNSRDNGLEAIPLQVETEDGAREEVTITIPEFRYSEKEAQRLLEKKAEELDGKILGENRTLTHIDHNLDLPASFSDSDITIQWSSTKPEYLRWDGTLLSGIPEAGCPAVLLATLYLQDQMLDYRRDIVLFPSEEKGAFAGELQEEAEKLNQPSSGNRFLLPGEWKGRKLKWFQKNEQAGSGLCLLLLAGICFCAAADRNRREHAEKKRKEQLELAYPELVSKIQLMTGAGLSVRNVFRRLTEDCRREQAGGKKGSPALEEAARTWQEMENGVLERDAYEHLGERCGLAVYRELALLLEQNRKRGNAKMNELLEQEAQRAFETRKRTARAEGEKVSVRLLLPMGMMLVIVMALILVPAFLSF